jgi:PAS domain S-box-containing protein
MDLPNLHKHSTPWRLFAVMIAGIFFAEIVAMIVVYFLQWLPYPVTTLVDATIMVILIYPLLYTTSFRPLLQHIEELQRAKISLHQKEELQERFFNSIDVMIAYMDRDFNFIKVNEAYARSAEGHGPEYFTGKNHFALYPHAENEAIFREVVATGKPYTVYEKPFEYPDQPERGTSYWNWSLQPVRGLEGTVEGVVLSLVDVTERKRAQQKAEDERSRLKSILDTMPDGVYIVNQQYEIEYTNPVIQREFGFVNGRKCYQYAHDRSEVCPWCRNPMVFEGQTAHWEWTEPATGRIYEVFDTPLTNADGSTSKLKLVHDVTSRKQAENELERRNLELQTANMAEHRQRQVAETLRAAAQELTESLELEIVLQTLLKHMRALVHCDTGSVIFREGESIRVQAVDGYEPWTDPNSVLSVKLDAETDPYFQKIASTRKSLLIRDTSEEQAWNRYPGKDPMRSRMFVPIVAESRLIGIVGLGKAEAGYFTDEHLLWAEAIVGQAAIAIQNAWLFAQVRAGRERLQTLSRRLVEIQEKERIFIARELHDQASQTLTSLMLGLGALEKEASASLSIQNKACELKRMTDQVLEELHRLAINLRPASLDHLGLTAALQQFIETFAQGSGLPIRLKTVGFDQGERLLPDVEATLYRIAQEALTNVVRHAEASRADVMLERRDGSVVVIIEDDGKGFDPDAADGSGRLGVVGMRERTEMLGGTLTIESNPGRGTTLFAEVPNGNKDIARG